MISKSLISSLLLAGNLSAHSFWVNSFESFTHAPGHTTVGLGWGHSAPIDDTLNSVNGKIIVESFEMISPDGKSTKLRLPTSKTTEANIKAKNFDVFDSDIALQKIAFKKDSLKGTYTILAKSKPTFYTQYIDKKDNKRLKLTTMDKIKDIKKILMSVKYETNAKSYLTLEKWEEPKVKNKGLELIPKTDLSKVKVGDLVEFEVLFYGKPINISAGGSEFITASSSTLGQKDGFALMSYIQEGKAKIRVMSPGKWIVNYNHKKNVTKDGELKDLYGKVHYSYFGSSISFDVK